MKTVIRTDRAPLRKPVITSQGFYRADAHVARVGIYEYRNDDGTLRRELRSQEEVSDPDSLASYEAAPVTLNHPLRSDGTPDEVTADNVKRLRIGTMHGSARMDDDHVAATVQVEDSTAIKRAKGGTQELSPGYRIVLDETPGSDPRYGYPGNPEGRWDARQTKIRVNHVALVDSARGGRTTRLRIDHSELLRDDAGGGNPHHDDHGRFAAGSSASAHAATAGATSAAGHLHAAQLHEKAAADHRTAGNATMAKAHDTIAQHHKAEAGASGHSGPGHEHSERAMQATGRAHRSAPGAGHTEANRAAAEAHDAAAAAHSKEGHAGAAAEHQRFAANHRAVVGTDSRIRPGQMSSPEAHKPEPPRERYVAPVASAKAKAASKAAESGERKLGLKGDNGANAPLSAYLEGAKLHDTAATEHGKGWESDYHAGVAKSYREIGTGAKPRPVYSKYRGDSMAALTSIVKGHQHTIDADRMCCGSCGFGCAGTACPYCGGMAKPMLSGSTSYAMSDGAEDGHSHEWLRAEDGTFTLSMNDGHTHDFVAVTAAITPTAPGFAGRADNQFDRSTPSAEREHMTTPNQPPDAAEQLRLLTVRADEAERNITEQRTRADTAESRAESIRADLVTAHERMKVLEDQIIAGSTLVETAAVLEQRLRADTAERELSEVRSQIPHLVRKRAGTIAKTMAVVGPTMRADAMTEREMLCHAVKHLRPKEDIGQHVSTDYLERRLDSLVEDRTSHAASMARASATLSMRVDAAPAPAVNTANKPLAWADAWRGGAHQFATKKD